MALSVGLMSWNRYFKHRNTPQRRKLLQIKNKYSKQIKIIVSMNSSPAASVTMFHPTWISCGYFCVTCVSLFNLRHPWDFTLTHVPKGNLVNIYIYESHFLVLRNSFLFRPRVFPRALGSVAHREPDRTPNVTLSAGRCPWHVLRGLKVARQRGEGFRARRAIRAPANRRAG